MIDYVFILAGGSGTRLWPASTSSKPKQFFSLDGETSLIQLAVRRARALKPAGGIIIITLDEQLPPLKLELVKDRSVDIPVYILPEPFGRNTAPAISTAVFWASTSLPNRSPVILVMTADHLIEPEEKFFADASQADRLAAQGYLVTFGITPERPDTGYGYIETGEALEYGYKVASFREKPDSFTAADFISRGNFLWNSGMFCFAADVFLKELADFASDVYTPLSRFDKNIPAVIPGDSFSLIMTGKEVSSVYETLPSISIDYAIMEKSSRAAVIKASFQWNDIGSWDVVAKLLGSDLPKDSFFSVGSSDNFVYSDQPVALCGVKDLIVVSHNGILLICKKGESQQVKAIVDSIKKRGSMEIL